MDDWPTDAIIDVAAKLVRRNPYAQVVQGCNTGGFSTPVTGTAATEDSGDRPDLKARVFWTGFRVRASMESGRGLDRQRDARDSRPSSWKGLGRPYLAENVAGSWGKVTLLMFSYSGDGSGHQGKLRRGRDRARARVIFLDFAPPNIKDKTSPGLLHWPSPCLASLR